MRSRVYYSHIGKRGQIEANAHPTSDIVNDIQWWIQTVGICGTAQLLGVHRMTINRIECGERVRKTTLAQLRKALNKLEE